MATPWTPYYIILDTRRVVVNFDMSDDGEVTPCGVKEQNRWSSDDEDSLRIHFGIKFYEVS